MPFMGTCATEVADDPRHGTSGRVSFFGGRLREAPPGRMLFSPDHASVTRDHIPVKDSLLAAHFYPLAHPLSGGRPTTPRLARGRDTCLGWIDDSGEHSPSTFSSTGAGRARATARGP